MNQPHEHHTPNGHTKACLGVNTLDNLTYTDPLDEEMAGTLRENLDDRIAKVLDGQNNLALEIRANNDAAKNQTAAIDRLVNQMGNGNGKKSLYLPIIAAVLISVTPQLFSSVWWTRGVERDTSNNIQTIQLKLDQQQNELAKWELEIATMRTWNEKLRNNMAERGYMVDPITAEIKSRRK